MSIRKIAVLTDFSPCSDRAIELALDLARGLGAQVQVLHCTPEVRGGRAPLGSAGLDPKLREEALGRMRKQVEACGSKGVEVEFDVEVGVQTASVAIAALKRTTPDLLVMGTHGRNAIEELILGSVADKCVREAPCPVLTVKC